LYKTWAEKPESVVLSWCLAVGCEPPGGSETTVRSRGCVRLAAGVVPPGGRGGERKNKALCAWRYATPARRSGSWQRLAARVPR